MNIKRLVYAFVLGLIMPLAVHAADVCSVNQYALPADIPLPNSTATASTFQEFSWQTFMGLNSPAVGQPLDPQDSSPPQWTRWSSTVDMLSCQGTPTPSGCECPGGDCAVSGVQYYPTACRDITNYRSYRVLDQAGKVDDSFLQAATGGVSNDPLIDRFGNFLRFEIVVSPATFNNIVGDQLHDKDTLNALTDDVNMWCGTPDYTGGDPANAQMGAMVLKAAWMDVHEAPAATTLDLSRYHTEDLLVYTPSYRNATGVESCELRKMAMVGMHVEHKTLRQPSWIWTTFEHVDNAPSCEGLLPAPGPGSPGPGPNTSCPTSVSQSYNFYGMECNNDDPSCATCNVGPETNDPGSICVNPTTTGLTGWCLDSPPAASAGKSKICRQVPIIDDPLAALPDPLPDSYPQAAVWNNRCATALSANGPNVWANYMLISGQWLKGSALPPEPTPPALPSCINVVDVVNPGPINKDAILPQVVIEGGSSRPFLGNTSMESYDRSNCMACHSKAKLTTGVNTDFMYWLALEVAALDSNFMSYFMHYQGSQCTLADTMVTEFLLTGAVQNTTVAPQTFDLVVAIQVADTVSDPVLTAHDASNPDNPWFLDGALVEFEVDPTCSTGSCDADTIFPADPGKHWVQFRTTAQVSLTQGDRQFSSLLRYTFPEGQCEAVEQSSFRVWATDSSEQQYANFVDAALVSGRFGLFRNIPVLGIAGLGGLALLLLLAGWRMIPGRRKT